MNCSHPQLPFPVNIMRAITYSCNCATAHFAKRFTGDELARFYAELGFESATRLLPRSEAAGHIQKGISGERLQLQALGERGVRVTALEVAQAYRHLANLVYEPKFQPILEGMEGAVQFGTGRAAQVHGTAVAGKTGSVQTEPGLHAAWFAGFAPSRAPEVVVATEGKPETAVVNIMAALKKSMEAKGRTKVRDAVRKRIGWERLKLRRIQ